MAAEPTNGDVLIELRKLHRRMAAAIALLALLHLVMAVSLHWDFLVGAIIVNSFAVIMLSLGILSLQSSGRAYRLLQFARFDMAEPEDVMESKYRDKTSQLDD